MECIKHLCIFEQRLFGDTTPVQTDTAQIFAFDNGRLQAQLSSLRIAARYPPAAAQNNHIKIISHEISSRDLALEYGIGNKGLSVVRLCFWIGLSFQSRSA